MKTQTAKCDLRIAPLPMKEHRGLWKIDISDSQYVYVCRECIYHLVKREYQMHGNGK